MDDDIQQRLDTQRHAEAFELLVQRYKDKMFRLACSMVRDEAQAEDLTQDALVKIWKALPGYRQAASLSTWIYTITRNTCLTELRKRATRPTVSLEEPGMDFVAGPTVAAVLPASGQEMDARELLAELPEQYQRVITLFYLEEKSYEDVAAMLGLPLGTVKTMLFRGRKELLKIGARHSRVAPRQVCPNPLPATQL